jgi:branched-chain amino acid aminotransferase
MVSLDWNGREGWHNGRIMPYQPIAMDPATVGLHYGQVIFEGLKAYRTADGRVAVFRPDAHGSRFRASARRLQMPELPTATFIGAVEELVRADADWVPQEAHRSLYLRPVMFASEPCLALRPAQTYRLLFIAFVTGLFFGKARPIGLWISRDYSRAAPGGTGAAKCAGNYAGSYAAQIRAKEEGCDQVVFLDCCERRWVEELGGMNVFFVQRDAGHVTLVTPPLSGTILPGVTRDSVIELARCHGLGVRERRVSVDELLTGCRTETVSEVFACGTAAQVVPVGTIRAEDGSWQVGDGQPGPVGTLMSDRLRRIQRGLDPDPAGWMHYI